MHLNIENLRERVPHPLARPDVALERCLLAESAQNTFLRQVDDDLLPGLYHRRAQCVLIPNCVLQHRLQSGAACSGRPARLARLRNEHLPDDHECLLHELDPTVYAALDILLSEVLDKLVLVPAAIEDCAAEQGAPIEGEGKQGGAVDEPGEVDDADGVFGGKFDSPFAGAEFPYVKAVGEEVPKAGNGLIEDVLNAVLVRESDHGGDLVEGEAEHTKEQTEMARCCEYEMAKYDPKHLRSLRLWQQHTEKVCHVLRGVRQMNY